jgi:hypothetical protein
VQEIVPGVWHWRARHEHVHGDVSSYLLLAERVLIDPMIPPEGLAWFDRHGTPEHVVLSNRHHDRHAWRLQQRYGCPVHCISNGVYELEGRGEVTPFEFGDRLPGGIVVHEVDAICPDETALHIPEHRALACADGVVQSAATGEQLVFVADQLMDDPERTKRGLSDAYGRLLELDFDLLLLSHGTPVWPGGKAALRDFVASATP